MLAPSRIVVHAPRWARRTAAVAWLAATLGFWMHHANAQSRRLATRPPRPAAVATPAAAPGQHAVSSYPQTIAPSLSLSDRPPRLAATRAADLSPSPATDGRRPAESLPGASRAGQVSDKEPADSETTRTTSPLKSVTRSLSRSLGSLFQNAPATENPPRYRIPVAGDPPPDSSDQPNPIEITNRDGLVSLIARDASLNELLSLLARTQGLNIIASNDTDARVSMTLERVPLEDVLNSVLAVAGYTWFERSGVIHVTSIANGAALPAEIQGRRIEVFELDYAAAADLEASLALMLSPVGKVFMLESDPKNIRKTREAVVVEDLPGPLERVRQYIRQIDRPPRQVLIEARILEVELSDDDRHGVNFNYLFQLFNRDVRLDIKGFANSNSPSACFLSIEGDDVDGLIECLETTTDAKTLASPKLLVVNGQEARIQIGEQLGFRVTTTTETSTMESVDFLDVGVVMTVTPRITRDRRVMLSVKPEVSSGQVNPDTGLPEEETTEVETAVLLENGKGLVVGGLIQEKDINTQSKVPYLGDLFIVGKLFQRRQVVKSRSEIIITLIPRILPYDEDYQPQEDLEVNSAQTPLLHGPLCRYPRPWEPQLPDIIRNPKIPLLRPLVPGIFRTQRSETPGLAPEDVPAVLRLTDESP